MFYVPKGASKYVWTSDLISLGCVKTSSNNNRRRVAVTGECEAIEGRVNIIYYIIYVYILKIYNKRDKNLRELVYISIVMNQLYYTKFVEIGIILRHEDYMKR